MFESKISQEEMRRIFRQTVDGPESSVENNCPSPESVWDAVRGHSTPTEAESLLEHTLHCAPCARSWRLAMALAAEVVGEDLGDSPDKRGSVWWRRKPVWWALAASLVMAIGLQFLPDRGAAPPALRTPNQSSSPAIESAVPEGEALSRDHFLLKWRPGPEGSLYTVRVVTEDLQPVATARNLGVSEYLVPEPSLAALPPGSRLFWEVRMESPDGSRSVSPVFAVRLAP